MQKQQGFTLIELMIVVAIIGILAAIAIPAYQDYAKRAKVSEGLSLASSAKTAVALYYQTNGDWPADNAAAGLPAANVITGNNVSSVEVGDSNGVITITYANGDLDGDTLTLSAADTGGSIEWTCASAIDNGALPEVCR